MYGVNSTPSGSHNQINGSLEIFNPFGVMIINVQLENSCNIEIYDILLFKTQKKGDIFLD
jgi:hypothetical protein